MSELGRRSNGHFHSARAVDSSEQLPDEHLNNDTRPQPEPGSDIAQPGRLHQPISFKRKQKRRSRFGIPTLFSSGTAEFQRGDEGVGPSTVGDDQSPDENSRFQPSERPAQGANLNVPKEGGMLDWYVEGPGRRVGYDDLTAIDWIFEYTKERQRKRLLYSNGQSFIRYARSLLDAGIVWFVLIATGIMVGILAAVIDVSSNWLGDIKIGFCTNGPGGGRFYLNRKFCCWGHDDMSKCTDWTSWRKATSVKSASGGYMIDYTFYILFSVIFAVCASFLVRAYAIFAKHSGIPEIKTVLGGFVIRRFMGASTLAIKSLGLCLSVASGLWLGKEGPLVHVACCCANLILRPFGSLNHNEARKREVLSAAAAAGISVAFGAPIGGVLFSLEQLSYYFPDKTMWQSFVCAMVAAMTLQALDPFRTGDIVLYDVKYTRGWYRFEAIPFILLGILGGFYGTALIRLNMKTAKWRRSRGTSRPILEVTIVAFMSALINFPNIFMRAQNTELVHFLFAECDAGAEDHFGLCEKAGASMGVIALLLAAALLAFLLASITFGLDVPAGIILPSLAVGALYGRALGITFKMWQQAYPKIFLFNACEPDIPCITPGVYAIVGAASALGGATRMTLSIVVIMFELTGALTYVIPIMIAVMLAKWCGDIFGKRGIYESWIELNEYPFLDHRDDTTAPDVLSRKVMTSIEDLTVIVAIGHTIGSLQDLLATTQYRGFPVVAETSNPVLLGYISRNELSFALKHPTSAMSDNLPRDTQVFFTHQPLADPSDTFDLRPWMDQTPITLNSHTSFLIVLQMFQRLGLRYVLFSDKGVLQGLLTKKDMWSILSGAELHKQENSENNGLQQRNTAEETGLLESEDGRSLASPIERQQPL